jgi:hypothetical protein
LAPAEAANYAAYDANSARRNTATVTTRIAGLGEVDVDVYAKSPYTGHFRLAIQCNSCLQPALTTFPSSTTVPYGGTATLTAAAVGRDPLQYYWYDVADESRALALGVQLQTPPLTRTTGFYVQVTDECGTTRSPVATVEVGPCQPPDVSIPTASLTVAYGSAVSVDFVISGTAPFSYQWFQGQPPDTSRPYGASTGSRLTVVAASHSESYWVKTSNACGVRDSAAIRVNVTPPARRRTVGH